MLCTPAPLRERGTSFPFCWWLLENSLPAGASSYHHRSLAGNPAGGPVVDHPHCARGLSVSLFVLNSCFLSPSTSAVGAMRFPGQSHRLPLTGWGSYPRECGALPPAPPPRAAARGAPPPPAYAPPHRPSRCAAGVPDGKRPCGSGGGSRSPAGPLCPPGLAVGCQRHGAALRAGGGAGGRLSSPPPRSFCRLRRHAGRWRRSVVASAAQPVSGGAAGGGGQGRRWQPRKQLRRRRWWQQRRRRWRQQWRGRPSWSRRCGSVDRRSGA